MATMEPSITRTIAGITFFSFFESALGKSCILVLFFLVIVSRIPGLSLSPLFFKPKKSSSWLLSFKSTYNLQPTTYPFDKLRVLSLSKDNLQLFCCWPVVCFLFLHNSQNRNYQKEYCQNYCCVKKEFFRASFSAVFYTAS